MQIAVTVMTVMALAPVLAVTTKLEFVILFASAKARLLSADAALNSKSSLG
jgi:hypothetical protein